ncbi:tetratricopeptide repeat protein [Metabacillus malikii]|uniref:Tetratricopeptide (TPR) repeat protein n=1 Tax=Metabacillus malikii TaxID=1504265 RepID=A0ABT9ZNI8_9BACI|nr:tetratricopeptide repeat protein [Metabacillus malikii]MDQ0232790.1 tetratricopeptide (TPR) repeat protein [Metabacillus malikii]
MDDQKRKNVIPFPNLKERYLDKGMVLLKEKKFQEALEMFQEAHSLDDDKAEVLFGLAMCYMELGELTEAKRICKKMLLEDIGHYFTVLQVYLTILIQLREYREVQSTIEAVLEENHLPPESAEQFYRLLEFSRKMNQDEDINSTIEAADDEEQADYDQGFFTDEHRQLAYIQSLHEANISKHFITLKGLLENNEIHPIIKTMTLQLMTEHAVDKEVTVNKLGKVFTVIPAELEDISEQAFTKKVLSMLDDTLGNENPTLFEAVKELWIRHLFVLYPLAPEPNDVNVWAAALHFVGYEMHGITLEAEEVEGLYEVSSVAVENACHKIYQIEEISYLQI